MVFEIGEVVFYPLRGSGVIEAIEVKTILNESKEHVVIQMKDPSMVMMIPTDRIENSRFRKISDRKEVDKVEAILSTKDIELNYSTDIKKRSKENQEKLSLGSFIGCSEVVRELMCIDNIKPLNSMEKTMLGQAKKLLFDELSIIENISVEQAEDSVNKLLELSQIE